MGTATCDRGLHTSSKSSSCMNAAPWNEGYFLFSLADVFSFFSLNFSLFRTGVCSAKKGYFILCSLAMESLIEGCLMKTKHNCTGKICYEKRR